MSELELLIRQLKKKSLKIATAESCTAGMLAAQLTEFSGSSSWFDRGFVTYSNQAKQDMLGVLSTTLQKFGAVSEQVALEMATGALMRSEADVTVAITGIAGPTGGSLEKPVGMVCFALASKDLPCTLFTKYFSIHNRERIRSSACRFAVKKLLERILPPSL